MMPTSMDHASDPGQFDRWIRDASDGSVETLGPLFAGCRDYLLLVANHAMAPALLRKAGASDVVQETFLEAQVNFARFRGRTRPELLAWLRRILECRMANAHRYYLRTEKRQGNREVSLDSAAEGMAMAEALPDERSPSPIDHALRNELACALGRALERLPEHYRRAFVWRQQDGCSYPEIGRRIGCTPEAARKIWCRAVCELRRELEAMS